MTFKEQIEEYLMPLPSEWRGKLTSLLCEIKDGMKKPSCSDIQDCETVTSLSNFTTSGSSVSIKYTDEREVEVTRSFDLSQVLNKQLDGIHPACLTDPTTWSNLSYQQRLQLLIDKHCDCCS